MLLTYSSAVNVPRIGIAVTGAPTPPGDSLVTLPPLFFAASLRDYNEMQPTVILHWKTMRIIPLACLGIQTYRILVGADIAE